MNLLCCADVRVCRIEEPAHEADASGVPVGESLLDGRVLRGLPVLREHGERHLVRNRYPAQRVQVVRDERAAEETPVRRGQHRKSVRILCCGRVVESHERIPRPRSALLDVRHGLREVEQQSALSGAVGATVLVPEQLDRGIHDVGVEQRLYETQVTLLLLELLLRACGTVELGHVLCAELREMGCKRVTSSFCAKLGINAERGLHEALSELLLDLVARCDERLYDRPVLQLLSERSEYLVPCSVMIDDTAGRQIANLLQQLHEPLLGATVQVLHRARIFRISGGGSAERVHLSVHQIDLHRAHRVAGPEALRDAFNVGRVQALVRVLQEVLEEHAVVQETCEARLHEVLVADATALHPALDDRREQDAVDELTSIRIQVVIENEVDREPRELDRGAVVVHRRDVPLRQYVRVSRHCLDVTRHDARSSLLVWDTEVLDACINGAHASERFRGDALARRVPVPEEVSAGDGCLSILGAHEVQV